MIDLFTTLSITTTPYFARHLVKLKSTYDPQLPLLHTAAEVDVVCVSSRIKTPAVRVRSTAETVLRFAIPAVVTAV